VAGTEGAGLVGAGGEATQQAAGRGAAAAGMAAAGAGAGAVATKAGAAGAGALGRQLQAGMVLLVLLVVLVLAAAQTATRQVSRCTRSLRVLTSKVARQAVSVSRALSVTGCVLRASCFSCPASWCAQATQARRRGSKAPVLHAPTRTRLCFMRPHHAHAPAGASGGANAAHSARRDHKLADWACHTQHTVRPTWRLACAEQLRTHGSTRVASTRGVQAVQAAQQPGCSMGPCHWQEHTAPPLHTRTHMRACSAAVRIAAACHTLSTRHTDNAATDWQPTYLSNSAGALLQHTGRVLLVQQHAGAHPEAARRMPCGAWHARLDTSNQWPHRTSPCRRCLSRTCTHAPAEHAAARISRQWCATHPGANGHHGPRSAARAHGAARAPAALRAPGRLRGACPAAGWLRLGGAGLAGSKPVADSSVTHQVA
jgi:hypothetical protein